ncbi:MAG: 3-hydroxybutyrate dehydrogenase, partial [Gammaproteobacteria bacterium]|nr:3-hydroxybutyrate dehydrogenase [Gammaproteobacteria bacterium]
MEKKIALVTGSTSGIGLGIARQLTQDGYQVVLNGIEAPEKVAHLCAELNTEYCQADLTKAESIEQLITHIQQHYGRLDILVNNAGIQHISPVENFPLEKWNLILQLNLTAAFVAAKAAIPLMKKHKFGRIINIASAHALVASPYKSAYVAAKHGLLGLTKVIALECANDGITCNAICPAYVLTPLVEKQIPEVAKEKGMTEEEAINEYFLGM